MATPSLKFVEPAVAEGDRVLAPEPVEIYGLPEGGGGAVESVNGQTGEVTLTASDVGARSSGDIPQSDVTGLVAAIADLTDRIEALETAE